MKKSSALFLALFLGAAGIICMAPAAVAGAEDSDLPVTQAWMREELNKIEARLTVIEENQGKILEWQNKLSEEHKQLRYWVHKN